MSRKDIQHSGLMIFLITWDIFRLICLHFPFHFPFAETIWPLIPHWFQVLLDNLPDPNKQQVRSWERVRFSWRWISWETSCSAWIFRSACCSSACHQEKMMPTSIKSKVEIVAKSKHVTDMRAKYIQIKVDLALTLRRKNPLSQFLLIIYIRIYTYIYIYICLFLFDIPFSEF